MRIRFDEIPPQGSRYEFREIAGLAAQQDFTVAGPVRASCTVRHAGDGTIALQARLEGTLTLVCDRCLSPFHFEVQNEWEQFFAMESGDSCNEQDQEDCFVDLDTIVLEEPVIDLDDVLRQQVYLALPVKVLCAESCLGICPHCGVNMNQVHCACADRQEQSPFAILARLKKST